MKVAVVGGGWAGLAAAVELAGAGVDTTVFEAARQLGGRARSVNLHGHRLDNGQHILVGAYRETLRLMRRVGADPDRLLKRFPLEVVCPGAQPTPFALRLPRLPQPWHLLAGLATTRGASLGDKLGALRLVRFLQRNGYRLAEDCTVSALLDRLHQHGALRRHLWEPLCLAALNTPPAQASAQIFANTLRDSLGADRAGSDLLLPAVDLDRLFPALAAEFIRTHGGKVRVSSRVTRIDDGFEVSGDPFDSVVLAVGAQHAERLLATDATTQALARLVAGYVYEPIATIYCGYPAAVRLPWPMLGLAADDRSGLGQWVFDRGALCGTAGVIAFVLSGSGTWQRFDDATLAATLHAELAVALNTRLPSAYWQCVIREQRATFSCRPSLPRPAARTARPGLWLAGDYVSADYPATIEAAVRSGVAAARGILG